MRVDFTIHNSNWAITDLGEKFIRYMKIVSDIVIQYKHFNADAGMHVNYMQK